jgi:amino acid adenylation domain-containing protein
MAELRERIAALSPEQRKLLEQRVNAKREKRGQEDRISPHSERGRYPLSAAQQRLWFLDAYHQGTPFYNFSLEYRIAGALNTRALFASLAEIVRRHEALRTTFVLQGEQPLQVVQSGEDWVPEVVDLQATADPHIREAEARRRLRAAAQQIIDLAQGPVFRAYLLRLGPTEHLLQIVAHHIAFDGWSVEILVRELEMLYGALSRDRPSPLVELPIQYGDFAIWQQVRLQNTGVREDVDYWKNALANLVPFEIETDHPRPTQQTFNGAVVPFSLSAPYSQSLTNWSRQQGVTLFMTLLAGLTTVLWRRSGRNDIAIGTAVANRNRTEIEKLIGFFVNTLVLRTHLSGDLLFCQLVDRVRETVLSAQAHQELPFEKLVEEIQPARDPSRNPLIQVLFVLQQGSVVRAPRMANLQVEHLSFGSVDTARFDLEFHVWEANRGLEGIIVYNTDLFEPSTVGRLSSHLREILSAVAVDPTQKLADLPALASDERALLLKSWSRGSRLLVGPGTLHQMIEQQVKMNPESVAIAWGREQVTYNALNSRANQVANYLQRIGVGPEVRVGICLERSIDLIVAMLAVLKAGGVYVPLDPAYPRERIRHLLNDAQVAALLSQRRFRELTGSLSGFRSLELDTERDEISRQSDEEPCVRIDSKNLAYIIYTSGSTGQPKGVAIQHQSAVVFSHWARQQFTDAELSGVLASTSICFDLSVFEIFVPLSWGGRVILVENALDVIHLSERERVRVMNTVPSAMTELLRVKGLPDTVVTVNLAGEALRNALVQQVYDQKNIQRVLNLYGPSEDTTYSTCACVSKNVSKGSAPIGRPIANTRVYVLNEAHQPVSVGTVGELYLSGDGLARGYLNRPDATAEKFLPNSFSSIPGARMYRTGDRVRWLTDGSLEFLGRLDHQVKIRGYRIELGEIEAALLTYPGIKQAVVVAREDSHGSKQLVAYLEVPRDTRHLKPRVLREHLRESLPEYMTPSLFLVLDRLPLTPNGKVDRHALPAPDRTCSNPSRSCLPPRDTFELRCTQIWEEVLGVRGISVRDDFFELGGHSLNAFAAMAKIGKAFQRDLPVSVLFQQPTVEHLAGLLRRDEPSTAFSPLVPLQAKGARAPFFCVHPAGGNVLCYVKLAHSMGHDQPFYGLQSPALADREVEARSMEEIAALYVQAVRQVQPKGPYFIGGYCIGGVFAFEMAHQLQHLGERVASLVLIDSYPPDALAREEFDDALALSWFGRDLSMAVGKRLSIPAAELREMPGEDALEKVLAEVKAQEVLPWETDICQFRRYFHAYLANSVTAVTYEPQSYHGRITLLRARDEKDKYNLGLSLGWTPFAAQQIEIREIPGDHATIILEPNVQILGEQLSQILAAWQPSPGDDSAGLPPNERKQFGDLEQKKPWSLHSDNEQNAIHLLHSYLVQKPLESVFAFLADPRLEPQWNPWIQEVKLPSDGRIGEGCTFVSVYKFMGRAFDMKITIERYVPPQEITLCVVEGPFLARTAYTLRSEDDGTTLVVMDFVLDPKEFFGTIPKPLLRPIFYKSMKDDSARQKKLMECDIR